MPKLNHVPTYSKLVIMNGRESITCDQYDFIWKTFTLQSLYSYKYIQQI